MYPANTLSTIIALCEFLLHSKDLEAAGVWAWYMDCPVPPTTVKRVLSGRLHRMWRKLHGPSRQGTQTTSDDRVDSLAYRYRYPARKLVGGTAQDAYRVVYNVLALVAGKKGELDLDGLVHNLSKRLGKNISQFGLEPPAIEVPADFRLAMRQLTPASLSRAIRRADVTSLEAARRFLGSRKQLLSLA